MRTILFLIRKEYLQIFRDRQMVGQIMVLPLIQLLLISNAATFQVRSSPMYVVDEDNTTTSRELVAHMAASGYFRVAGASTSEDLANEALLRGRASLVLHVPASFEKDLLRTRTAPVQLVLNAENGATAGVVQSYAMEILSAYAAEAGRELRPTVRSVRGGPLAEPAPARGTARIETRTRGWYNPDLRYSDYMVPGILVVLVTMSGTLLAAMSIAREKEIGTLEQLNVTPITRAQFIAGKLAPFWMLAMVQLSIGLVATRIVFHIPMRGSLLVVYASAAVYMLAALGVGLFLSTLADTQQQAQFVSFFVLMLYLLMSGLFTPIDSMPGWAQVVAQLNPVTHFIRIMRAVLMKGAGFADVREPLLALVAYAAVVLAVAVARYRKVTA
jgi:ABC-2 type transport system permease protein